jgi:hypothetical protein
MRLTSAGSRSVVAYVLGIALGGGCAVGADQTREEEIRRQCQGPIVEMSSRFSGAWTISERGDLVRTCADVAQPILGSVDIAFVTNVMPFVVEVCFRFDLLTNATLAEAAVPKDMVPETVAVHILQNLRRGVNLDGEKLTLVYFLRVEGTGVSRASIEELDWRHRASSRQLWGACTSLWNVIRERQGQGRVIQ